MKSRTNVEIKEMETNNQISDSNAPNEQQLFKEIIEKSDINEKVNLYINDTIELLTTNILALGREDTEKYELIEKEKLVKLKQLNLSLKEHEEALIKEYNKIVEEQIENYKDLEKLKKIASNEQIENEKSLNQIFNLKLTNRNLLIKNEKLKVAINEEHFQRDNIYKTLKYLKQGMNRQLPKELKDFVNNYPQSLKREIKSMKLPALKDKLNDLQEKLIKIGVRSKERKPIVINKDNDLVIKEVNKVKSSISGVKQSTTRSSIK